MSPEVMILALAGFFLAAHWLSELRSARTTTELLRSNRELTQKLLAHHSAMLVQLHRETQASDFNADAAQARVEAIQQRFEEGDLSAYGQGPVPDDEPL